MSQIVELPLGTDPNSQVPPPPLPRSSRCGLRRSAARRDLRAPACPTARPARSRCASAALGRPWRCGVVVLTPEGYDNLHTGDSHRSPICHTGDSHRSRFVTPEPSHRRRVDHTGSICSAHTGISTQQNFARPNSGVTLASPAAEIQRKVASKRLSASSMQERGRDRDEKEERREKREEREEKVPSGSPPRYTPSAYLVLAKRLDYC